MDITTEKKDKGTLLKISGRMDAITAPEYEKAFLELVDQGELLVVSDMSGLEYISSAGLRSILTAAKRIRAKQGDVRFCGLTGMVEEVFQISGFMGMFKMFSSEDEAFSA
ncbi:STAS domain-containing protein [Salidesulfovibrio onnuriiensis]|uniref:STAS domain-containing protein n=1 Tax=Salidesulfovibrio onnuriiensis TaxID=2583823 RepID=UPI0011CBB4A2|nr:STAS domain-containing protein [Salidesulfovibrio onnuriiensis]